MYVSLIVLFLNLSADTLAITPQKQFYPLSFLLEKVIKVYQFVFSDIQGDVCNFTPSCSRYAGQAIKKHGPIKGTIMAFDRLERCNYFSWQYAPEYYKVKWTKQRGYKLYDPVE